MILGGGACLISEASLNGFGVKVCTKGVLGAAGVLGVEGVAGARVFFGVGAPPAGLPVVPHTCESTL